MAPRKEVEPTKKATIFPGKWSLLDRFLSTKLLLTAWSLWSVFYLMLQDKDVSRLEILLPAILLFYNGTNVAQDVLNKRNDTNRKKNEEV